MGNTKKPFPVWIISEGFDVNGRPNWPLILGLLGIASAQAALVFGASAIDNTLWLPDEGDGFLEHYGVWAILVTDPLLLISVSYAHYRFFSAIDHLPLSPPGKDRVVSRWLNSFRRFLYLDGKSSYIYILLVVIALLSWINNLRQTLDPILTYGNDVFDSYEYSFGFYANKLNLFFSWVVVYPIVGFELLTMSISLRIILQRLVSKDLVAPKLVHPDECYGLSSLGVLNAALLAPYFLSFCVIFLLLLTHEQRYFSVIAPLVILSVILIVVSFITIGPIRQLGRKVHKEARKRLVEGSRDFDHDENPLRGSFELERLCFATVSATPYPKFANSMINMFRIVPVAATIAKVFF